MEKHYLLLKAPWPVSDRDGVFHLTYTFDAHGQPAVVRAEMAPDAYPRQKGIVRLTEGVGIWNFNRTGDDRTELTYYYHGEPGGSIPAWLANSVVVDNPLRMLENFHALVELERYSRK